jgi:beta-N-acetylhexosaminidase
MPRSGHAAGMVMGGVGGLASSLTEGSALELFASYASAGIRAFLLPGALAADPERLSLLTGAARRASAEAASGADRVLVAIGGGDSPAFGLPPFPCAPSPLGLASYGSTAAAKRSGLLLGSLLASCGVDMVLGPSLDLASDPKDPAGALDGFGEDGRHAGVLGAAYASGLAKAGVAACVGRFPGLGATCRDCYEGMPFIALPAQRLERCEMRPFSRAVATGVDAVFVGRVLVPSLESDHIPASSSARVIEGRLRDALGFKGLVIGGDIGPGEEPGRAAVLGALAGCDLCLFTDHESAILAARALDKASSGGELPSIRVETARRRFDRLVSERRKPVFGAPRPRSGRFRGLLRKAERDIEAGFSLLRGSLALDCAGSGKFDALLVVAFLPPEGATDASESDRALAALRAELPGAEVLGLSADPGGGQADELSRLLSIPGRFREAAILSYDAHFRPSQESLARLVGEYQPRFRLIAMRDPYDAAFFPNAVGLGAVYGFSESRARGAARLLAGKLKARGGRPVEVIGLEV